MKQQSSPFDTGFSLVELSVVLVILGLLVGGVLLSIGSPEITTTNVKFMPIMSSEEAALIDRKVDDGLPYTGQVIEPRKMHVVNGSAVYCAINDTTNEYPVGQWLKTGCTRGFSWK